MKKLLFLALLLSAAVCLGQDHTVVTLQDTQTITGAKTLRRPILQCAAAGCTIADLATLTPAPFQVAIVSDTTDCLTSTGAFNPMLCSFVGGAWTPIGGGGGGGGAGNPGGSGTQLQYRSGSSFGGITGSSFAGGVLTLPATAATSLNGIRFVEGYGAVCDGTTNDYTALNAAIQDAVTNHWELRVPPGKTCAYGTTLTLANGYFGLTGGAGSTLKYTGVGDAILIDGTAIGNGAGNVLMRGFAVDAASGTSCLHIKKLTRSHVSDIECRGTSGTAFILDFAVSNQFDNLTASSNNGAFTHTPTLGILLTNTTTASSDNTFINPKMEGIGGDCAEVQSSNANLFLGGTFEGCTGRGLYLHGTSLSNTFNNTEIESNSGTHDIEMKDGDTIRGTQFINLTVARDLVVGTASKETTVSGGNIATVTINAGALATTLAGGVRYSTLTDNGTATNRYGENAAISNTLYGVNIPTGQTYQINSTNLLDTDAAMAGNSTTRTPSQSAVISYVLARTGSTTSLSALTNPSANTSFDMAAYTLILGWSVNTGASNLFTLTDFASNTGTGYLANFPTAASSTLKPFRTCYRGTTDCVVLNTTTLTTTGATVIDATKLSGALPAISGASLTSVDAATLGTHAAAFFQTALGFTPAHADLSTGTSAANVVGLFNTGTCSGYLKSDGTCDVPTGAGTVTHTGGALTLNKVMLGAGTADSKVDSALTSDGAGTFTGGVSITSTAFVGALTGNASTATAATTVTNADDTTTNADFYPLFTPSVAGNYAAKVSSTKLTFHPSTGLLTATAFSGKFTGTSLAMPNLLLSSTAPTISTHFNTSGDSVSANNGTAAFTVTVGTGTGTTTGVIGLPTATTGWHCMADNLTRAARIQQTASSTTSCTLTNMAATVATPTNWSNSDVIAVSAFAY